MTAPGDAVDVAARVAGVRERIHAACAAVGRSPDAVRLLAVSKRQGIDAIRAAHAAGQRDFGENYAQELVEKAAELSDLEALRWHFIGHLQRNKARLVLEAGAVVQSLDSTRLIDTLEARAASLGRSVEVWLQVNLVGESSKSGVTPDRAGALCSLVAAAEHLQLQGLMTIAPEVSDPELSRPHFRALRSLCDELALEGCSMGMSADLEVAIQEGSTLVRVGTAVFGPRPG